MARATQTVASILSGISGALIVGYLTLVFAAPLRWDLRFPGRYFYPPIFMLLAVGLSLLAVRWGSRRWYWLTACAVLLLIYLLFDYHPPAWI